MLILQKVGHKAANAFEVFFELAPRVMNTDCIQRLLTMVYAGTTQERYHMLT